MRPSNREHNTKSKAKSNKHVYVRVHVNAWIGVNMYMLYVYVCESISLGKWLAKASISKIIHLKTHLILLTSQYVKYWQVRMWNVDKSVCEIFFTVIIPPLIYFLMTVLAASSHTERFTASYINSQTWVTYTFSSGEKLVTTFGHGISNWST